MKKIVKKVVGIILGVCLFAGQALPSAATGKVVTKDVPEENTSVEVEKNLGSRRYPVGGLKKAESSEISDEMLATENLEEVVSDENTELNVLVKESLNSGLSSSYAYNQLSSKEKEVYNIIKTQAFLFHVSGNNATAIEASLGRQYYVAAVLDVSQYRFTFHQMEKIYFAIEADFPELFWICDTLLYTRTQPNGLLVQDWCIVVESEYYQYSARKSASDSIKRGMIPFMEQIDNAKAAGASQMELELLIHDMIIGEVDYAYTAYGSPETATFAHSVVGVLDGDDTTDVVCEGYAKTFHLLSNYAGLESIYGVGWSGTDENGGGHAWNLIKIDGKWYNIDLTWDDTNSTNCDGYSYDFYNLTTEEFNRDKAHDYRPDYFGGMYDVPNAVATEANYYNYFGLNVTGSDLITDEAFKSLIKGAVSCNEKRRDNLLRFNCENEEVLEGLEDKLMDASLKNAAFSQMDTNGTRYAVTELMMYPYYNQLFVSVSKIYAENVCEGYVFGNPETTAKVYKWENRQKQEVTGDYAVVSNGAGTLTITNKTSGEVLGAFNYKVVTPVVENIAAQQYTGNGICPAVSISVNGMKLQNKRDYVVEYSNHVNVGTAKATIKGLGNYAGTIEKTFVINRRDISKLTIALSGNKFEYDGKAKTPQIVIKDGGTTLVSGRDYNVSYKNNTAMGLASVLINGKGNYTGSKVATFTIIPAQASNVKLSSGTGKTLKFSWKKQSGASGYEVSLYKGSKKIKVTSTAKTSYKFSKLKENSQYTFKVRAYKKINGTKQYGSWSSKLAVKTAAKSPSGFSVTAGNKKAVLKWKKTSGVSGYEIYMSTKQKSGYKKIATIKKGSTVKYTKKKLSKNKTYYFKIRSYTTKNNFKSYSGYSAVKKVKIK